MFARHFFIRIVCIETESKWAMIEKKSRSPWLVDHLVEDEGVNQLEPAIATYEVART